MRGSRTFTFSKSVGNTVPETIAPERFAPLILVNGIKFFPERSRRCRSAPSKLSPGPIIHRLSTIIRISTLSCVATVTSSSAFESDVSIEMKVATTSSPFINVSLVSFSRETDGGFAN